MDAVCAKSGRQSRVVLNQQRTVGVPRGTNERRHDRFRMGLSPRRETDERAGYRRGFEGAGENPDKGVGVSDRQEGSDEIERAAGRVLRGQRHERQKRTGNGDVADQCGQIAVEASLRAPAVARIPAYRDWTERELLTGYRENAARRRSTWDATSDRALIGSRECATIRLWSRCITRSCMRMERSLRLR